MWANGNILKSYIIQSLKQIPIYGSNRIFTKSPKRLPIIASGIFFMSIVLKEGFPLFVSTCFPLMLSPNGKKFFTAPYKNNAVRIFFKNKMDFFLLYKKII